MRPKARLWLLTRNKGIDLRKEAIGFVVRASSAGAARRHAAAEAGEEGGLFWMSEVWSDCQPLPEQGKAGVILRSGTTD